MAKKRVISTSTFVDPDMVGQTRPAGTQHEYQGTGLSEWFCNSCGNPDPISGDIKVCPTCGNPKDSSETYVQPTEKRPYLSAKQMADQGVDLDHGSDEQCPFCNYRVAPKTEVCPNCGGSITDVGKTILICPGCGRETNNESCASCGSDTKPKSAPTTYPRVENTTPPPPPNWRPYIIGGAAFLGLVALIMILVSVFTPKINSGIVSSNSWTCSVPVQEYQYNQHGGWNLPGGADFVSSGDKFHHNDKVYVRTDPGCEDKWEVVGSHEEPSTKEECTTKAVYADTTRITYDDGTYDDIKNYDDVTTCIDVPTTETVDDYGWVERCNPVKIYKDVPVYQTWYEYKVWEWTDINPLVSTGSNNIIACSQVQTSDTIRQGGEPQKSCETIIVINDEPKVIKPNCNTEFPLYNQGSVWQVTTSAGIITKVEPLP